MQNGHDPLQAAIEQAQAQRQAQQMQAMALNAAANNPHTIERIEVSAVGIATGEDGSRMLLIATLDGRRRDVKLSPDSARLLLRALADGEPA